MDIFVEKIVSRKKGPREYILSAMIIFISIIVVVMASLLLGPRGIVLLLTAGLIVGDWYLIGSFNVEYEYSITNGEIDIDKIINRRKRKKLITADCKDIEIMAKVSSKKFNESIATVPTQIKSVSSMDSPDVYFVMVNNGGKRSLIYFQPDEKIMKTLKASIPSKIFEE
ncbi:DUF6106 family protein [Acetivibrio cellulolyticus]|uniref:DUF6106 family protein n=1 Tax=Acetivibrio cellulolyticus TaxID=35830 RepID=UPI0001E2BE64|nr:DUF6106 family protein [Acetivibrio cellulolyticus]